jgi:ribulose-phosphate 3-epimerase
MVKPVDRIIPDFAKAGANIITFHPEASEHIDRSLSLIRDGGCQAGLVFNPATPLDYMDYVMDKIDVILLMSVNPASAARSSSRHAGQGQAGPRQLDAYERKRPPHPPGNRWWREYRQHRRDRPRRRRCFVAGSAVYGAGKDSDPHRYDSIIGALRSELAKV